MTDQADELALPDRKVEVPHDHRLAAVGLWIGLRQVRDLEILGVAPHAATTASPESDAFARATGAAVNAAPPRRRPGPNKYSMTWLRTALKRASWFIVL